jgi:hypothetical protein
MPQPRNAGSSSRPKGKSPEERSAELIEASAKLKAEAAARREARAKADAEEADRKK